jgi:cell division septation protein DedD
MSNNRPRAVDPKRKRDEALNVADFKIDDILNVPGDQLLAEVAEDFGDPGFLAAQFDSIALPGVSSHNRRGVDWGGAMVTFPAQPAAPGAACARAFSRPPPAAPRSFSRAALVILAEWLVAPLRRRVFWGAFATVLLVVALTPGIYPLLVDRSDDRMTTILLPDEPLTQLPAPTLSSGPLLTSNPAPVGPADQSPVEAVRAQAQSPVEAVGAQVSRQALQAFLAEREQRRAAADGRDQAAASLPDRQGSQLPSASVTPRAPAQRLAAVTPTNVPPPAAARPRVTEGGEFFVELSARKSAAEALSTLRDLQSKYAVLKGHKPFFRRKDEGERSVIYTVQVGPFQSWDNADQLCKQLKTAGEICFVTRD